MLVDVDMLHQERSPWSGSFPHRLFAAIRTQVSRGTGAGMIGRAFTIRSKNRELARAATWSALSAERLGRTSGCACIAQLLMHTQDGRSRSEVPFNANRAQRAPSCIAELLRACAVSERKSLIQGDRMAAWDDASCQLSHIQHACGERGILPPSPSASRT